MPFNKKRVRRSKEKLCIDTSNTVLIYLGSIKEIKKKAKLNRQHVTDTVQYSREAEETFSFDN